MTRTSPSKGGRLAAAVTGGFFVAIPLLSWCITARMSISDRYSKATWLATDCVIQEIEIWQTSGGRPGHLSDEPTTVATIKYGYQFNGIRYTSDRVDLRTMDGLHTAADRDYVMLIRGYHNGQRSTCWVNPRQPSQAVLTLDIPAATYAWHWWPDVFFIVLGLTLIVFAKRQRAG